MIFVTLAMSPLATHSVIVARSCNGFFYEILTKIVLRSKADFLAACAPAHTKRDCSNSFGGKEAPRSYDAFGEYFISSMFGGDFNEYRDKSPITTLSMSHF